MPAEKFPVIVFYRINGWYLALLFFIIIIYQRVKLENTRNKLEAHLQRVSEEYPLDYKLKVGLNKIQAARTNQWD